MVSEPRKQSMAWMETDYSKHAHFRWKIKRRLEHLGALGTMVETAPLKKRGFIHRIYFHELQDLKYTGALGTMGQRAPLILVSPYHYFYTTII